MVFSILFVMYAMKKRCFRSIYILLSDLERLCPGDRAKALVAFQLTEILSVAFILVCIVRTECLR